MMRFMFLLLLSCFSFVWPSSLELQKAVDGTSLLINEKDIHVYYYSQKRPNGTEITHQEYLEDMSQTDFSETRKTIFAVHGWHNNFSSRFCEGITEAYLSNYDVNIFLLDYREVSKLPYPFAFLAVRDVADIFGRLINALTKYHGLDLDKSIILGHSLGAQIAGITGAALNGQIDTIIVIPGLCLFQTPTVDPSDVRLTFYSQSQRAGAEIVRTEGKVFLNQTDFDPSKRTILVIHGWINSDSTPVSTVTRDAFLDVAKVNVFVTDWSSIAWGEYTRAFCGVVPIGEMLAQVLSSMRADHELSLDNLEIVGHSLGAHIAGVIGESLNGEVDTIIGLDPANPLFNRDQTSGRLDASDAKFVQCVHTSGKLLGVNYDTGDADYYANDGKMQPGCGLDIVGLCAHYRSFRYFDESLKNGSFIARKCGSYEEFVLKQCSNNPKSFMGQFDIDKIASGRYYFETNAKPPYAVGG